MEGGGGIASGDRLPAPAKRALVVPEEHAGERLDRVLAQLVPELSRSRIQRLIGAGRVQVDERTVGKSSLIVDAGQQIRMEVPVERQSAGPRPRPLDLRVLHEDDDLVVIDKPAGLVVHAGAGDHEVTLVDGLLHRYGDTLSRRGGAERPGIVHRLDKGTSGVMVIARNDRAHEALARQFAERTVDKEYLAVVYGCPAQSCGEIDLPLGRDRADRTKISSNTDRPRDALSRWEVAEDLGGLALMRVFPRTGRMHQVRAHLTAIHHPCVGDDKYVGAQWKSIADPTVRRAVRAFERPALHARRLTITHPRSHARMSFAAPLPDDLERLLDALRRA